MIMELFGTVPSTILLVTLAVLISNIVGKLWNQKEKSMKIKIGYIIAVLDLNVVYLYLINKLAQLIMYYNCKEKQMLENTQRISSALAIAIIVLCIISAVIFFMVKKIEPYNNLVKVGDILTKGKPPISFLDKIGNTFFNQEYEQDEYGIVILLLLIYKIISLICLGWLIVSTLVQKAYALEETKSPRVQLAKQLNN